MGGYRLLAARTMILVHYAHIYGKSRGVPVSGVEEFIHGYRHDAATLLPWSQIWQRFHETAKT